MIGGWDSGNADSLKYETKWDNGKVVVKKRA